MILSSSSDEDADIPILSKTTTIKSEETNVAVKEENVVVNKEEGDASVTSSTFSKSD